MPHPPLPIAGAQLTIDLGALCANWQLLDARTGAATCAAVIKADAYGLGAQAVAPALYAAGCRHFFVAHLSEGLSLRDTLPSSAHIYILHGLHPGAEADCVGRGLTPVLNSPAQVDAWQTLARRVGHSLPALLQVDTGMARLGMTTSQWLQLAAEPGRLAGLDVQYVMSHLVCAEDQDSPVNAMQRQRFHDALAGFRRVRASLANSSGIFLGTDYHFDLVRPGAALYGVAPMKGRPNPMHPVIRLQAQVVQVRDIDAGTPVGYSHTWTATRPSRIATVAVGYADGYLRSLSNRGIVHFENQALPLVGTVSMDTITVDITDVPEGRIVEGSLVDLADPAHGVDAIAARAGTIGYEILTSLGQRYARRYVGGPPTATESTGGTPRPE